MLVHHHLEYWARVTPDSPAASDPARSWTYAELDDRANQSGHAFRSVGIRDGDRVAILSKNSLEFLAAYFGAFKIGAVPVPLNYRLAPREWAYILDDSAATVLLAQTAYVDAMESVRSERKLKRHFVLGPGGAWSSFDELADSQPTMRPGPTDGVHDDHALYQMYTSGTTGRPKGAVLTHSAVEANLFQLSSALAPRPGDDVLTVMPLYHAGSAVASLLHIAYGAHLHVMSEFDPLECVRELDEGGIAFATFVPAMIQAMLVSVPDVASRRYERLQLITYGASPIAEHTLRRALEVFGCRFAQGYGMTETSACLTLLLPDDHDRALAGRPELLTSCGRPVVGTDVRIVDADDRDVPVGAIGEVVARGPQVMQDYWNQPDATAAALRGGYMHTGDAGFRDIDGFIYLCDRIADVVVSGGENVYPREVEDVIFEMPGIADCAVIGVPDERWGEAVVAVVVSQQNAQVTSEEVVNWCSERLARFKCPQSVTFVETLPRNPSGKVLKTELRAAHRAMDADPAKSTSGS